MRSEDFQILDAAVFAVAVQHRLHCSGKGTSESRLAGDGRRVRDKDTLLSERVPAPQCSFFRNKVGNLPLDKPHLHQAYGSPH